VTSRRLKCRFLSQCPSLVEPTIPPPLFAIPAKEIPKTKPRYAAEARPELSYQIGNQELLILHADIKTVEVSISVKVLCLSLSPQFHPRDSQILSRKYPKRKRYAAQTALKHRRPRKQPIPRTNGAIDSRVNCTDPNPRIRERKQKQQP